MACTVCMTCKHPADTCYLPKKQHTRLYLLKKKAAAYLLQTGMAKEKLPCRKKRHFQAAGVREDVAGGGCGADASSGGSAPRITELHTWRRNDRADISGSGTLETMVTVARRHGGGGRHLVSFCV